MGGEAAFIYTSGILLRKAAIHRNETESLCLLGHFVSCSYLMILFKVAQN